MPWDLEGDMKNCMFEGRYLVYNGWIQDYAPSGNEGAEAVDFSNEKYVAQMEGTPDCEEEDAAAVSPLLHKLGMRAALALME